MRLFEVLEKSVPESEWDLKTNKPYKGRIDYHYSFHVEDREVVTSILDMGYSKHKNENIIFVAFDTKAISSTVGYKKESYHITSIIFSTIMEILKYHINNKVKHDSFILELMAGTESRLKLYKRLAQRLGLSLEQAGDSWFIRFDNGAKI